jgi:putative transposase
MPHSHAEIGIHIVFSTKDRSKLLAPELRPRMWGYLSGICKNLELHVHAIGGASDHVHLLVRLPPILPLAKAVNALKSNSSKWASEEGRDFAWQEGYAAFSVSASLVPAVARYIRAQEAHHKKMSFEAELAALLRKHGVKYDPAFLFG